MKRLLLILAFVAFLAVPLDVSAHSGRTDSSGGHYNRKTGQYHYHNGGGSSSSSSSKKSSKTAHSIVASNMPSSMTVGQATTLDWTVDGMDGSVTWSSSDENVVYVSSEGVLTARAKGSAKIRAAYDGSSKSWTVKVTPVAVESIELSPQSVLLRVGESSSISAEVLPLNASNTAVTWKSAKRKVAAVSAVGVVDAVAEGITKITATAKDSSKVSGTSTVYVVSDIDPADFPIQRGSKRSGIVVIQTMLAALGDLSGDADGSFGPETEAAIAEFQRRAGTDESQCTLALYERLCDELSAAFAR